MPYAPSVSVTRLLWALAVVLAVVVVGLAIDPRSDAESSVTVIVAKQMIPAGIFVKPSTFTLVTVPQDEVAAGTISDIKYIALHRVAHPIYPGERFTASDFSP